MLGLVALIIASDKGRKLTPLLSKYTYEICGQAMISYAIDAGLEAGAQRLVVLSGQDSDLIRELIPKDSAFIQNDEKSADENIIYKIQDAFKKNKSETILILPGEYPLINGSTLKAAYEYHLGKNNQVTVLTNTEGSLSDICFINTDLLLSEFSSPKDITTDFCIKNIIKRLYAGGQKVDSYCVSNFSELLSVNDSSQLSEAERIILNRIIKKHMDNGVIFHLSETSMIDNRVKIGKDTIIHPGTILEGNTIIGENCNIGPYSRIQDSLVKDGVHFMNSVMIQSQIGNNTTVGPFAYIRPGSKIGENIKIGDFVEIKNSNIGNNSKVPHLSYIGDADVGKHVNVGCGAVVVNYNGKVKNRTLVGDHAFVGCNVNLVSPVVINDYAYIAAGSTITDEVPEYALAIARNRQTIIADWVKRKGLDRK